MLKKIAVAMSVAAILCGASSPAAATGWGNIYDPGSQFGVLHRAADFLCDVNPGGRLMWRFMPC